MIVGWSLVLPKGGVLPASPWTFCGLCFHHFRCCYRDYYMNKGKIAFYAPKLFKQWKLKAV